MIRPSNGHALGDDADKVAMRWEILNATFREALRGAY